MSNQAYVSSLVAEIEYLGDVTGKRVRLEYDPFKSSKKWAVQLGEDERLPDTDDLRSVLDATLEQLDTERWEAVSDEALANFEGELDAGY